MVMRTLTSLQVASSVRLLLHDSTSTTFSCQLDGAENSNNVKKDIGPSLNSYVGTMRINQDRLCCQTFSTFSDQKCLFSTKIQWNVSLYPFFTLLLSKQKNEMNEKQQQKKCFYLQENLFDDACIFILKCSMHE